MNNSSALTLYISYNNTFSIMLYMIDVKCSYIVYHVRFYMVWLQCIYQALYNGSA